MMECIICKNMDGESPDYIKLGIHLRQHGWTSHEYYDEFLKRPDEGFCKECGKPTEFERMTRGYFKFCNTSCSMSFTNKEMWKDEFHAKRMRDQSSAQWNDPEYRKFMASIPKGAHTGIYCSVRFKKEFTHRSGWELSIYMLLDEQDFVESYEVEPFTIPYEYSWEGSSAIHRNYLPDILVTYTSGIKVLVEVKPDNQITEDQNVAKFKAAIEYCKENGIDRFEVWTDYNWPFTDYHDINYINNFI